MCECYQGSWLYLAAILISVSTLGILIWARIKFKRLGAGMCGVAMLVFHILVFSTVRIVGKMLNIDIVGNIASMFPYDIVKYVISYTTWCAAIMIQTLIEVLLMTLLVVRRQRWTRSLLTS